MIRQSRLSHRPSKLSTWYTSLPPPMSEETSAESIIVTLVAREVTSPETIVVADPQRGCKPHAKCSGKPFDVRKGEQFNLKIDIQPYRDSTGCHLPGAVDAIRPPSYFYVRYEDTDDLSTQAQMTANTDVRVTVRGGKCQGLAANSWDILNLQHIELFKVAIHCPGHYYLYLIVEKENGCGAPELLAKIRTKQFKVSR
ncbi:uncharacterized protein F4807DRAFT_460922 [Annulohypoxylon truncatum]|uniref:uncharacterized protein n=1 Tax=Annulohypoxylon truncatum TaxID=327061 RepID=UPI0020085291|nr:uncharacterized protein F4807DRAFT_460922 [Annulohypoxylon truncatum]KAI1209230.1 hypothetical protein F4807DRAFT_460922 [Annulohypoxylon truncatum]